jgi:hypothetical protein
MFIKDKEMANLEVAKFSQVYSYTFPAMVLGTATSGAGDAVLNANFNPNGSSRVLGFRRTTAGGVVGQPYIQAVTLSNTVTFPRTATVVIVSGTANTDTSVYTMYWVNETLPITSGGLIA